MKRSRLVALILALTAGMFGCSSPAPVDATGDAGPEEINRDERASDGESASMGPTAKSRSQRSPTVRASEDPLGPGRRGPEPRPLDIPYPSKVKVLVQTTPRCVSPGETVEIDVITQAGAPLAYQAVYAGNKSGAEPPFGEGYGGNDDGFASDDGTFSDRWLVRLDAPRGAARVDVVVGWEGEFGYSDARFAVADEDGSCPEKWLRGGD